MSIYCLIPARGGSKRIKNKNLLKLKGKPLINHTIKHALNSKKINKIFVSTDEEKIIKILPKNIYVIKRPINLSGDSVSTEEVIFHFLNKLKKEKMKAPKYIVLLQCTSPFREKNDIDKSISLLISKKYDSVWTVSQTDTKFHPDKQLLITNNKIRYFTKKGAKIFYRQQLSKVYHRNSNAYIVKRNFLKSNKSLMSKKTGAYKIKSKQISIDTLEDIKIAEKYL